MTITANLNRVHLGDCLAFMQTLPAASVDVVFADPPFNLKKNYLSYKDNLAFSDYLKWTRQWVEAALRILRPTGSLFIYNIPKLLTYTAAILNETATFRHWIAWNANGRPLGKTLQPAHYGILYYVKNNQDFTFYDVRSPHKKCRLCKNFLKDYGGKEYLRHAFGTYVSDVWDDIHRIRHNKRRIEAHPCQLPVHLIERLLLLSTDPGDVVFDPFMGAGTTAIACRRLGRNFIGTELDATYAALAQQRALDEQPTLIEDVYVSLFLKRIVSIRDCDLQGLLAVSAVSDLQQAAG